MLHNAYLYEILIGKESTVAYLTFHPGSCPEWLNEMTKTLKIPGLRGQIRIWDFQNKYEAGVSTTRTEWFVPLN
jgi:hypothetical protein